MQKYRMKKMGEITGEKKKYIQRNKREIIEVTGFLETKLIILKK